MPRNNPPKFHARMPIFSRVFADSRGYFARVVFAFVATFCFAPVTTPLNAYFFDTQYTTKSRDFLEALDIDSAFHADLSLFEMHHEKTTGERWEYFLEKFDRGYVYIPIVRKMLNDAGLPQELLYLAMAESEFSPRAYSKKRAAGLWQIMPSTARMLGLRIDDFVDERRDPIKSTRAAIAYLKSLYEKTGKWYLAAMAYNCGIGRLQRAIEAAGSDDIYVLMDKEKGFIPAETRRYIRKIISMGVAFSNEEALGEREHFLNRGSGVSLAAVKIPAGTSMDSIAQGAGLDIDEIQAYNKQFKYDFLPPMGVEYDVYIPYDHLLGFKRNFKPQKVDLQRYYITHSVKKGDTLYGIAKKYGMSVSTLKNANKLQKNTLSINQKLIIPLMHSKFELATFFRR